MRTSDLLLPCLVGATALDDVRIYHALVRHPLPAISFPSSFSWRVFNLYFFFWFSCCIFSFYLPMRFRDTCRLRGIHFFFAAVLYRKLIIKTLNVLSCHLVEVWYFFLLVFLLCFPTISVFSICFLSRLKETFCCSEKRVSSMPSDQWTKRKPTGRIDARWCRSIDSPPSVAPFW